MLMQEPEHQANCSSGLWGGAVTHPPPLYFSLSHTHTHACSLFTLSFTHTHIHRHFLSLFLAVSVLIVFLVLICHFLGIIARFVIKSEDTFKV